MSQKAYFDPFTKKTGIAMKYVAPYEFNTVRAIQEAGRMELDSFVTASVLHRRARRAGAVAG
jgi:hypothetical protein